jgi:hypothetical protein
MATKAATTPTFPKFDVEALVSLQKANYEAFMQVQKIVTTAVEGAWQAHMKRLDAWKAQLEGSYKGFDLAKKPEAYAKDAQVVVETALAEAKVAVESGVKTQREVAQLLADRFVANINEFKALAA